MMVQFFHLLALALWVGGSFAIGILAAPSIFKNLESRTLAGNITGEILSKLDKLTIFCIIVLAVTSMIKFSTWENANPWILTRYAAISIMSLTALYSIFVVSSRMKSLKEKIGSFDASTENNPYRSSFRNLHKVSSICMLSNLIFGVIAILLA
jgi:uncharacterized membrane protein